METNIRTDDVQMENLHVNQQYKNKLINLWNLWQW